MVRDRKIGSGDSWRDGEVGRERSKDEREVETEDRRRSERNF